jgi:curli biogenesis system outer membrane secretion channel CsgG
MRQATAHLILATALGMGGCGSGASRSWQFNTPPAALGSEGLRGSINPDGRVVVVGRFDNPTASALAWKDLGQGMSEALSQALLNQGRFDVWSNQKLAKGVAEILEGPTPQREQALGRLHDAHRNVRFVITGKVTDFHHTGELPPDLRRRGFLFGTRDEAIVAVQFTLVDLQARRVLVADHVHGTASTGRRPVRELYRDVAFGSYLFWSSPLGQAAEEAIELAVERVNQVVPTTVTALRVIKQFEDRKIVVSGDATASVKAGQEFYVCRYDEQRARLVPVNDPVLEQPLRARILSAGGSSATAWLIGERPVEIDLRGAELWWDLPRPDQPSVAQGDARRPPG